MDHLPVEILHMICANLRREDVLSFRLLATLYAGIGAQYMLPAVSIAFLPESFARLKAISEHPVISQHVRTLVYELGRLPEITDFKDYKRRTQVRTYNSDDISWPPPAETDERAQRAYNREMKKIVGRPILKSSKILKKGWDDYLQLHNDVAGLQDTDAEIEVLESAIARFPRLSMIRVQSRYQYDETGVVPINAPYNKCFVLPEEPDIDSGSCGVKPLEKLLLCATAAGIDLQNLWAGPISCKFFVEDLGSAAPTVGCRRHLRELRMEVGCIDYDCPEFVRTLQLRDRVQSLSNGGVRNFLTASPDLQFIELLFERLSRTDTFQGLNLESVFGIHTWGHLERLDLRGIRTSESCLVDFFQRHAETLKCLTMEDFCLADSTSSWESIFEQIPEILDLESADLRGKFDTVGSNRLICMDLEGPAGLLLGDMVSHWVLVYGMGRCHSERIPRLERRKALTRLLNGGI
ncbi:hypothetical protein MMC27_002454 [Xylographa pallens]|nr:hypothetical protein [Xylographa pallens]